MATLHYIFDPLCGWCYGAAPLVDAAARIDGLTLALHAGGMMTGPQRRQIDAGWRDYVLPHDRRIAELSGQPFGSGYTEGLLRDTTAVMDSAPPTTAILAAEQLAGNGVALLHRLQRAHYVEGQRIADLPVLTALAQEIGLPVAGFNAAYQRIQGVETARHIAASRALLHRLQGQGFPTFALEDHKGRWQQVSASHYLGKVAAWQRMLETLTARRE